MRNSHGEETKGGRNKLVRLRLTIWGSFNYGVCNSEDTASAVRIGKAVEEVVVAKFKALPRLLTGGSEENHRKVNGLM